MSELFLSFTYILAMANGVVIWEYLVKPYLITPLLSRKSKTKVIVEKRLSHFS